MDDNYKLNSHYPLIQLLIAMLLSLYKKNTTNTFVPGTARLQVL